VATGSRVLDLSGWIWHILLLIFIAALLWWRELSQATELEPGIYANKTVFSGSSALAFGGNAWRLLPGSFTRLPWRKIEVGILGASSSNKRLSFHLHKI
jgi:hypothetical protein